MAGQVETPSKAKSTRAVTPDGSGPGLPTPAPSGRANITRPKQLPTVTPRRFNRFFTPRSSLKKGVKIGASRQALRDITAGDSNRRPLGRRRSPNVETIQVFEDENVGPDSSSSRKRKRGIPNTPEPTPELSSPLKRLRPQSAEFSDIASEGEAESADTSPRSYGRSQEYAWKEVKPVVRWRQIDMTGQRLLQESGGFPGAHARAHLSCGSEWQHETADFYTRPEDSNSCINVMGTTPKYALPFCATSCNTNSLVAVGDEEGGVRLLETDKSAKTSFSKAFLTLRTHGNAVLDLAFSPDDLLLATASGDQTSRIIDMMTQKPLFTMAGHTSSVKQVKFQSGSSNVLATSSRDGSVLVWDLRCKGQEGPVRSLKISLNGDEQTSATANQAERNAGCVNAIREAAMQTILKSSPNRDCPSRTEQQARRGEVSVTTLAFLPTGREHLLLTSSEADATVKLWDLRTTHSRRHHGATPLSSTKPPQSHISHRNFGLTSMVLSGDAARLYTLCRDNTVYAYSTSHLILGHAPEFSSTPPNPRRPCGVEKPGLGPIYGFRHTKLHATTFYVRMALRPAIDNRSELLAVGSSDECAVLFPTDERYLGSERLQNYTSTGNPPMSTSTRKAKSKGFFTGINEDISVYRHGTPLVRGHDREVTDLTWTYGGDLVTVGDDLSARCWREGPDARDLRIGGETEGRRWGCGWAETRDGWDDDED